MGFSTHNVSLRNAFLLTSS